MGDVVQRVAARGLRDARGEDERGVHQAGLDDDARRAREARPAARERDEPRALGVDAADAPDDEACGLAERCLARRRGGVPVVSKFVASVVARNAVIRCASAAEVTASPVSSVAVSQMITPAIAASASQSTAGRATSLRCLENII